MSKQIPFGIIMRGQRDYMHSEVSNFIECADGIEPLTLRDDPHIVAGGKYFDKISLKLKAHIDASA